MRYILQATALKTRMCPKYMNAPLALSFSMLNGPLNWVKNLIWH